MTMAGAARRHICLPPPLIDPVSRLRPAMHAASSAPVAPPWAGHHAGRSHPRLRPAPVCRASDGGPTASSVMASPPLTRPRGVNTQLHVETPLIHSNALSAALGTGAPVFLKLEASQPSGSFKLRGIGATCAAAVAAGAPRLVSSSGGNAGLAVAHSARALGVPCTVVRGVDCVRS
jgi:hypothetical protein